MIHSTETYVLTLGAKPTDLEEVKAGAVKADAPAIRERAATASFMIFRCLFSFDENV